MDRTHQRVGRGGDNRKSFERLSLAGLPAIIQPGKKEWLPISQEEADRLLPSSVRSPFIKRIGRNGTSAILQPVAKGRFGCKGLRPSVDITRSIRTFPRRLETPSH